MVGKRGRVRKFTCLSIGVGMIRGIISAVHINEALQLYVQNFQLLELAG